MRTTFFIIIALFFHIQTISAQEGFTNPTRALYILDISKYVEWPPQFLAQEYFTIAVLDKDDALYWELENLTKTRRFIQGKPARVYLYRNIESLEKANVLYVNSNNGFNISELLKKVKGNSTLVISEGYKFRESMLNFVSINGKPKFELNEKLLNEEGMKVNELFLAQAIKTREDWEQLFEVTQEELVEEKEITAQQRVVITAQDEQIKKQMELIRLQEQRLDSLDREIRSKLTTIIEKERVMLGQEKEIKNQKNLILEQLAEVEKQKAILLKQTEDIKQQTSIISEQTARIDMQGGLINDQLKQIEKQKLVTYFILFVLALVSVIGYVIFLNYRNKKKANVLLQEKNRLITMQRDQIAYQKKHITDSIEYAKRIQRAILPSMELFSDKIDHFILYKPRDIVSGDFYWVDRIDEKEIIITADCTGHGVPGAFMSMLGVSLLNEIVKNKRITRPDLILNELRASIISSLKQLELKSEVKDGMDMTALVIDYKNNQLQFAGANNPMVIIRDGELQLFKGDKMPVAIHDFMDPFNNTTVELKKGDAIYTFSDGYPDQFGGPSEKKFLIKNFKDLLLNIHQLSMFDQAEKLNEVFEEWRKEVEQVDDVTVVGIRY
jgi:serine phosphatase RsbU (regulator of sigma subunit)